jgi:hypothetical protein
MKLTGKCKEDFEKWFLTTPDSVKYNPLHFFYEDLSEAMKYGVYVDFFDSVEIYIDIIPYFEIGTLMCFDWEVNPDGEIFKRA